MVVLLFSVHVDIGVCVNVKNGSKSWINIRWKNSNTMKLHNQIPFKNNTNKF
jgi:hypothetical protein